MNRIFAFGLSVVFGSSLHAQTINLRGVVSNGSGQPVAKAVVELVKLGIRDTTGSDGAFSINKAVLSNRSLSATRTERESIKLDKGVLEFTLDKPSPVKIEVFDVKGNLLSKDLLPKAQPGTYHLNIDLNIATNIASDAHSDKILIVQASIGPLVRSFRYFPSQHVISEGDFTIASPRSAGGMLAKLAAAVDTLNISAVGYTPKKIGLSAYDTTVNVTLSDATTVYNPCPTNGSPCKILPFGDSITEGVKSSDGGGYRSQLFKLIVA
ncbi:MAG: carboxypeptidase-like regulatory domain-containing protein, partial [Fibrobacteria bacterium]